MNNNTQQEGQSDYETEWELDTDDPQTSSVDNAFDQQSSNGDTVPSDEASDAQSGATSQRSNQNSAESDDGGLWANATPEQQDAYRRAENERVSANNRAKLNADKLAERGRELKALRERTLELEEAGRQPTEFEAEHEVYAKNIEDMIERKLQTRLPPVEEPQEIDQAQQEQQTFDAITTAHPDAGELYKSQDLQEFLSDDPVFKHGGRAVLFSEALHSNDPADVVAALDHYKNNHSGSPQPKAGGLENMQGAPSRGGKPDMRTLNQMSSDEQYAAEWDLDDD